MSDVKASHSLPMWSVGDTSTADLDPAQITLALRGGAELTGQIGVHEAIHSVLPRSNQILIRLPGYRGKSLIPALAWLAAARLARPEAMVTWLLGRQQGPKSLVRMLEDLDWTVHSLSKRTETVEIRTSPSPAALDCPAPATFVAERDGLELHFAADYGVFSPDRIDDGTSLLIEFVLNGSPIDTVADIGIGYGAIALTLVKSGHVRFAYGTDIDCIALALAQHNADTNGVPLEVVASHNPLAVPPTPLTVCNIPTHIDASATGRLCASLATRARDGALAVVVHASLAQRYTQRFAEAGVELTAHSGASHVVLHS